MSDGVSKREVTLLGIAEAALLRLRPIIRTALVCGLLVGAWRFLQTTMYTSVASFMPQESGSQLSGLAGVAAQFGLSAGSLGSGTQSPDFYARLVKGRDLSTALLLSPVQARCGGVDTTERVIDWIEVEPDDSGRRVEKGLSKLLNVRNVITELRVPVVRVEITTSCANLSSAIAKRTLELIVDFDQTQRSTQAQHERIFLSQRLQEARDSQTAAEGRLAGFLVQNRTYQSSPLLSMQADALRREVDFQHQIVSTLEQSFEQARLTEVRDTPMITIVDTPVPPSIRDRRQAGLYSVATMILVGFLGIAWAIATVLWDVEAREDPSTAGSVVAAWGEIVTMVRRRSESIRQKVLRR